MSLSRRAFVHTLGVGAAGAVVAGRSSGSWLRGLGLEAELFAQSGRPMLLHNNENPYGPGERVMRAVRSALADGAPAGRYQFGAVQQLHQQVAAKYAEYGVRPENVHAGHGSTQILRSCVHVFTDQTRFYVGAVPSYEECTGYAELIGTPVRAIPLNDQLGLDLPSMVGPARGAGLIFINNPNNPTATVQPADDIEAFIDEVHRMSPETYFLVDEAYHEYALDPRHRTQIPLAMKNKQVIVARTFSKAYGMAGLRVGYAVAHADTIKKIAAWDGTGMLNLLGIVGATEALKDDTYVRAEARRNEEVRSYVVNFFQRAGMSSTESGCNFIFVNVNRPVREFRDGVREHNIIVGRDFPPYLNYCRISLGTMDEMKRATEVFAQVLGVSATAAAA